MKKKTLSALVISALLPLAAIAQTDSTSTGKPTAGSGAVPIASPTPIAPETPNANTPDGAGKGKGSGKGASGTGDGTATGGGVNQQ